MSFPKPGVVVIQEISDSPIPHEYDSSIEIPQVICTIDALLGDVDLRVDIPDGGKEELESYFRETLHTFLALPITPALKEKVELTVKAVLCSLVKEGRLYKRWDGDKMVWKIIPKKFSIDEFVKLCRDL